LFSFSPRHPLELPSFPYTTLFRSDVISICVPTPLGKTRDPDVSYVVAATAAVAKTLRPGQLIILESTTYPGTTRELMLPALEARDRKSTRLNSSHVKSSYAVFCLK